MKLLLTVLLLVHTIQSLPEFSRDACLQTINSARAAYAEQFQIANMNSLNYNKRLEPVILQQLSFVNGCPEPSIISHKNLDIYLNVRGQEDLIVELLSGTENTVMACVKSKCNGEPIVSIVTDKVESAPITGPPGTECSSEANSNGLCVLENVRGGYTRKGWLDDLANEVLETLGVKKPTTVYTVYQVQEVRQLKNGTGSARKGFLDKLLENQEIKDILKDYQPRTVARPSFDSDDSLNSYEPRSRARRGWFDVFKEIREEWRKKMTPPPAPIQKVGDHFPMLIVKPKNQ